MSFVGIYAADGTFTGELRYMLGKCLGTAKCALCDITHGWNPLGSRRWKAARSEARLDLLLVHRNEAVAEQLAAASSLPSIVAHDGNAWTEVLGAEEISELAPSGHALLSRLEHISQQIPRN